MRLKRLQIKNFRCFSKFSIDFDGSVTVLSGDNGVGKTTILEALHYMCYMRSFRTHTPKDLIRFEKDSFFVKVWFESDEPDNLKSDHELQVGFSKNKRLVKLNKKSISSFRQLMDFYRVVTLTEDDLQIIKGSPDERRSFIDQAILLFDPEFIPLFKEFRTVLDQRNSLLQAAKVNSDSYQLWSEQLFEKSKVIQNRRSELISEFEGTVNTILQDTFDEQIRVKFEYKPKNVDLNLSFEAFQANKLVHLEPQEMRFCRSLFGAHLDDIVIHFQQKKSKWYASRGQQKLIILLLKAAQLIYLSKKKGAAIFLLDDFMSDFDEERARHLLTFLLSLNSSLIFTSPSKSGFFEREISQKGASILVLTP